MTGGQRDLALDAAAEPGSDGAGEEALVLRIDGPLRVVRASAEERAAHERMLQVIAEARGGAPLWPRQEGAAPDGA